MANPFGYPVPYTGTKGVYQLAQPFSTSEGEILECTAVRTLASYIANNDDALSEVYKANGLTEDHYSEDLNENMKIVTLVNKGGYVYLVPAKYIQSYPIQDGVYYRPLSISTALPLMPMTKDLSFLLNDIQELIKARLGVASTSILVETAAPRSVDAAQSKAIEVARSMAVSQAGTSYEIIASLQHRLTEVLARNQELEQYVINHP